MVFVEYTRSPEARCPVALEEAYAATVWIAEHGQRLELDRARLAVAGDSAGGNLATATALLAKRRGGPRPLQQVLFYPSLDAGFDTPSYEQFADGFLIARAQMRWAPIRWIPNGVPPPPAQAAGRGGHWPASCARSGPHRPVDDPRALTCRPGLTMVARVSPRGPGRVPHAMPYAGPGPARAADNDFPACAVSACDVPSKSAPA